MTKKELIDQLRQMSVETGSLVCLGCGYEHNCGINGCDILKEAADAITDLLSRTEAADARCETLEKMMQKYQEVIIPGFRELAEKAEICIEEVNTAILLKSKTEALNAIKRWRDGKEE